MGVEYIHPSVSSRIIDNSFTFVTSQGTTLLFACGKAKKGLDNKLIRLTNVDEAKFILGEPDIGVTGQTLYNVFRWLKANGEAYFIRVLPIDASYANLLLSVTTRADGDNHVVIPKLVSKPKVISKDVAKTIVNAEPVTRGSDTEYPLGMILPKGRGEAYNGFGVIISLLDNLDTAYAFRTYSISFTEKDTVGNDVVTDGPYTVSFEPTAKDRNRESLYWANVINKYSLRFEVTSNTSNIDDVRSFINSSEEVNPLTLDVFFGKEKVNEKAKTHNLVKFATSLTDGLSTNQVSMADAANLKSTTVSTGGFEGTWEGSQSEDSLVAKAYTGQIDSDALDKKQYQFDVILDGNCSPVVKNAMNEMASVIREDIFCMLDCSFQATAQQTVDYRTNVVNMSSFNTAIFAQDLRVDDEYTGREIKVTIPYILASKVPETDIKYGIQYSFSGPRRGVISGFNSINFIPNEPWKETLYKKQINYIEKDPKRYNLGTQLTSQTVTSALSKINNVRALLRIRRDVEAMMDIYRDEFQDGDTYSQAGNELNNYLVRWKSNRTCSMISGSVYASDYDKTQNLARVKIELRFTGLIERIAIDIVVNK